MKIFTPTPLQMPECKAWFDFSDTRPANIQASGNSIVGVLNKTGNGNNLSQSVSANRPQTGTRTIKGLNVADFDGTNDSLMAPGLSTYFTTGILPFTVFAVFYTDVASGGGSRGLWSAFNSTTSRYISNFKENSPGKMILGNNSDAGLYKDIISSNTLVSSTPTISCNVFDGTNVTNYQDGAIINTGQLFANGVITLDNFSLGSIIATSFLWDGVIGEFIFYGYALTTSQIQVINSYLLRKWA